MTSNEDLVLLIQQGHTEYIPELWESCRKVLFMLAARLCDKFSERMVSCGYTREDIEQDCFLILLKMIEAYDPCKGYKFTSYANFHIKAYFLRDVLGYDRSKKEFVKPLNGASSLDKPIGDGEDEELTPMSLLEDETAELAFENTVESIYQNELRTAIEKAMCECLNETQRRVIHERYFKSNTLKQTAELAGTSTLPHIKTNVALCGNYGAITQKRKHLTVFATKYLKPQHITTRDLQALAITVQARLN